MNNLLKMTWNVKMSAVSEQFTKNDAVVVKLNLYCRENVLSEHTLPCSKCQLYIPIGTQTAPPSTVWCSTSGLSTQACTPIKWLIGMAGLASDSSQRMSKLCLN